ncbi:MAG: NAD(+) synthase [Clostridia bacterium]|nr:NAD(+) synthase [Clostridia bacterium]
MKHGLVKVAAVSPKLKVADVEYNVKAIQEEIVKMAKQQVEVLVFPELCLCGYTCGDLFFQPFLMERCLDGLRTLTEFTKGSSMLVFVGLPIACEGKLYDCAAVICDGKVLGVVPKKTLRGESYETRYFTPAMDGGSGVLVPLWKGENAVFGANRLFTVGSDEKVKICVVIGEDDRASEATMVVNLSASSEIVGRAKYRRTKMQAYTAKHVCVCVCANPCATESTTDEVFSGHNIVAQCGEILSESKPFGTGVAIAEVDVERLFCERVNREDLPQSEIVDADDCSLCNQSPMPFIPTEEENEETCETVLSIQAHALATRMTHIGAKTAVIGISGGLDSTLALLAVVRAFDLMKKDRKDIIAITMPGFGTTGKTYQNALKLIELTGATLREISIKESVLQHFKDIGHDPAVADITYENAQARMRTLILMDVANQTGGLVIGTGDLSELALGWCTYSGDHISNYSLNCSIPKTLVKHLVAYVAGKSEEALSKVLFSIAGTDISPELLPPDAQGKIAQKTEDLVGPYELHDFYLYHIIRCGCSPSSVFALAKKTFADKYDDATLLKWLRNFYKRFFSQQFKRSCSPDGVKVGVLSLSPRTDWRMPSDASAAIWLAEVDALAQKN